ncbi:hypothetical protein DICVIV_13722 [Dictyocaulus viviparus]|uniref:Peptidase S1 domain-containing protein n=1 Tax=Dictyocaulus viviparus TaxID=29172 RepID=A0A0D8X9A0_DICVI|nr:hypothetical protein DICVIV_13722 [Dictyocaulus viviparus]
MPSENEEVPANLIATGFYWNRKQFTTYLDVIIADDPKTAKLQAVNLTLNNTTEYDEVETLDRAPCHGDSGGSLFKADNGKYILLGIHISKCSVPKK